VEIQRIVRQIGEVWPEVKIILRASLESETGLITLGHSESRFLLGCNMFSQTCLCQKGGLLLQLS
jgi:hypothetical protein